MTNELLGDGAEPFLAACVPNLQRASLPTAASVALESTGNECVAPRSCRAAKSRSGARTWAAPSRSRSPGTHSGPGLRQWAEAKLLRGTESLTSSPMVVPSSALNTCVKNSTPRVLVVSIPPPRKRLVSADLPTSAERTCRSKETRNSRPPVQILGAAREEGPASSAASLSPHAAHSTGDGPPGTPRPGAAAACNALLLRAQLPRRAPPGGRPAHGSLLGG